MSPLPIGASQPSDSASAQDASCRVKYVVPTGAVFAAALDRLNRKSTVALFQALAHEIDEQSRKLTHVGSSSADVGQLRAELVGLLALLRQTTEQHNAEVALIKQQLVDLQEVTAKHQAEFEDHLAALISLQIEQHMASTVNTASGRLEQNFNALIERDLKPLSTRLSAELEARQQPSRRSGILLVIIALLLAGGFFMVGLLSGRRVAPVTCPANMSPASCAGTESGRAPAAAAIMPLQKTESAQAAAVVSAQKPETMQAALAGVRSKDAVQDGATNPLETTETTTTPVPSMAAAQRAQLPGPAAGAERAAPDLMFSGWQLRPNSMEAELFEFLTRPGAKVPHLFTMDRLKYPPQSHEVNPEGKEQVFLLAKMLLAYPKVRIEIRGHNDGTETEVYTGPNPVPGYTMSQLRADCVLKRLTGLNVPLDRMRLRGMGKTQPVDSDATAEGRQNNRRVEIVVLSR